MYMTHIVFGIILFLDIMRCFVIADVILSWFPLIWITFRPRFIATFLDPLYTVIQKYIPTKAWIFDLTALILLMALSFIEGLLILAFPAVRLLFL